MCATKLLVVAVVSTVMVVLSLSFLSLTIICPATLFDVFQISTTIFYALLQIYYYCYSLSI